MTAGAPRRTGGGDRRLVRPDGLDRKVTSPYAYNAAIQRYLIRALHREGDTAPLQLRSSAAAGCLLCPSGLWVVRAGLRGAGVWAAPEELTQIGTWDAPGRGRYVTVAYQLTVISGTPAEAGDDAVNVRWWPLTDLPPLAFDHADIIAATIAATA